MIDIAIPISQRKREKIEKYLELATELSKIWKVKCKVIPIVTGALETVPKKLEVTTIPEENRGKHKNRPNPETGSTWNIQDH